MPATTTYHIVAYPHGARHVVGILHARYAVEIVQHARAQAATRGEYVDVERAGTIIATVDAYGPVGVEFE